MLHILGWVMLVLLVVALSINAAFMLISPRMWFRLPDWIRANGSFTEKQFETGWGAIHVRIVGALALGTILWVLYDALFVHR